MFSKINHYYTTGLWNITRVANMVTKIDSSGNPVITADEFKLITGKEFTEVKKNN